MKRGETKENPKTRQKKVKPEGLRMKDLTQATGLPKSAILHYVAQELLPEPVKTGPNMAYYHPGCVERIKFIKTMQEKYAFPLSKIKMLLSRRDEGADIAPLVELSAAIFGPAESQPITEKELCQASGLKPGQMRKLMEYGLLIPLELGKFNQQDVEVCGLYAKCFALGADMEDFESYAKAAEMIVDMEMRVRSKLTAHLPEKEDVELTGRMVTGARLIRTYVIERTFQQRVASRCDLKDTCPIDNGKDTPETK